MLFFGHHSLGGGTESLARIELLGFFEISLGLVVGRHLHVQHPACEIKIGGLGLCSRPASIISIPVWND